jgi:hypothetical protein
MFVVLLILLLFSRFARRQHDRDAAAGGLLTLTAFGSLPRDNLSNSLFFRRLIPASNVSGLLLRSGSSIRPPRLAAGIQRPRVGRRRHLFNVLENEIFIMLYSFNTLMNHASYDWNPTLSIPDPMKY